MRKFVIFGLIGAGLSAVSLSSMAAFTTSSVGTGQLVDGGTVGNIINNLLGEGGAMEVSVSDLSSLASSFGSGSSYDYPDSSTLAIFDSNHDGSLTEQEFADMLAKIGDLTDVMTAGGRYAQAYATELAAMTAPRTIAKIQNAITIGNTYSVDAPQINTGSAAFSGDDSAHSASLGLVDGLGKSADNASLTTSFTVTHDTDSSPASKFAVNSAGTLSLASSVDIEDLEAGTYTFSVSTTDTNTKTYGLVTTRNVSLTVSNERGCIVHNTIASADFDTNGDSSLIEGAKVTISGSHNANDLLFVRTATKATSGNIVTYTNVGVSGITGSYDKTNGQLSFSGSASLANWASIFQKVGYIYDDNSTAASTTRSLIFSLSDNVVFNHVDSSSHFYKYISQGGALTFEAARVAADNSTLFGLQGYLATITSANEQDYIEPKLNGIGWIGGCDRLGDATIQSKCGISAADLTNLKGKTQSEWDNTTGHWKIGNGESYFYWVTGPERLEFIGEDTMNCNGSNAAPTYKQGTLPVSGDTSLTDPSASIDTTGSNYPYHNFFGCEPNNYRHDTGGENYMHVYSHGGWNDYRHNDPHISGYLVEYGGMSGDPAVDLTENKNYNTTTDGQFCTY